MEDSEEDVEVYKVLSRESMEFYSLRPPEYNPSKGENLEDFQEAYIKRWFARKANDENAPIIEIDEENFNSLKHNPFYTITTLSWKISGPATTVIKDGIEYEEGVSEYNFRRIHMATKNISGLHKKLPDLYQFYKAG